MFSDEWYLNRLVENLQYAKQTGMLDKMQEQLIIMRRYGILDMLENPDFIDHLQSIRETIQQLRGMTTQRPYRQFSGENADLQLAKENASTTMMIASSEDDNATPLKLILFQEPIQVTFVADMEQEALMKWFSIHLPGGKQRHEAQVLRIAYGERFQKDSGTSESVENEIRSEETDQPTTSTTVTSGQERVMPEIMDFSTLPMTDGRTFVTATCFGIFTRSAFDELLAYLGETFHSARPGLIMNIKSPEKRRLLPVTAEACDAWQAINGRKESEESTVDDLGAANSQSDTTIKGRQRLLQLQETSRAFLILLAEKADFDTNIFVEIQDIISELSLAEEANRVANFLEGKALLKVETWGGSLRITPEGIRQVEIWLEAADATSKVSALPDREEFPLPVEDDAAATKQDTMPERRGKRHVIGPIYHAPNSETQNEAPRPESSDFDKQVRLAKMAKKYGERVGKKIKTDTIATWEKIVASKMRFEDGEKIILKNEVVCELTGLTPSTYAYHRRLMIKSGYWRDAGLPENN